MQEGLPINWSTILFEEVFPDCFHVRFSCIPVKPCCAVVGGPGVTNPFPQKIGLSAVRKAKGKWTGRHWITLALLPQTFNLPTNKSEWLFNKYDIWSPRKHNKPIGARNIFKLLPKSADSRSICHIPTAMLLYRKGAATEKALLWITAK